jgi:KipI family sensor histidine kinase inhibitor
VIFAALGDSAVVVTLSDTPNDLALVRVRSLAVALAHARIPGIVDVVPAYVTVAVFYEAARFATGDLPPFESVCREISACARSAGVEARRLPRPHAAGRTIEIPVCYGGEFGADLAAVAGHCGIAPEEVSSRHSQAEYRVQAIGFVPGFPYLSGLPDSLRTPRRDSPRASVPAGSVGIGGSQTGVYPLATPGGWQIIGRTPLALFRPHESQPALLQAGDQVKFRSIDGEEFNRLSSVRNAAGFAAASAGSEPRQSMPDGARAIRVIKPGLLTTVQDLGRRGHRSAGVPLGGAMDAFALRIANQIVGNPEDAAGLEITLLGPELEFAVDTVAAVGGAEFEGAPTWRPLVLRAGERLIFGECKRGCRAYLAVAGGIDVPPVLGSRSTYLQGGFGGFQGRALREGDWIAIGPDRPLVGDPKGLGSWRVSSTMLPSYSPSPALRALRGAQAADFGPDLWTTEFQVSPRSDRMGLRLSGPAMVRSAAGELISTAVAPGTMQVPPDGQPILLMADAQTIGGYPQAAHIIGPDLSLAAQLRPGESFHLREIPIEEAHRLAVARERDLAHLHMGLMAGIYKNMPS